MAVYGASSFAVLQAADVLIPALHLPESMITAIAVLALLGFPLAIALAWYERFGCNKESVFDYVASLDFGEGIGPAIESGILAAESILTGGRFSERSVTRYSLIQILWAGIKTRITGKKCLI